MGGEQSSTDKSKLTESALFNSNDMSDITFIVKGRRFPAHKFILAPASPVFYAMFYGPSSTNKKTIEIPDCENPKHFFQFLSLIYKKPTKVTWENVEELSYLRKKYEVSIDPGLLCGLLKSVKDSELCQVLQKCVNMKEDELVRECVKKISRPIAELVDTEEFLKLDQPALKSILKQDSLNIKEIILFGAVDKWCSCQVEKRKTNGETVTKREVIGDAIYYIRFSTFTILNFFKVCSRSALLSDEEFRELSTRVFWKSEYGCSSKEIDAMINAEDGHISKFPSTIRANGHLGINFVDDAIHEYIDMDNCKRGCLTFSANTDIWLKAVKSNIHIEDYIEVNNCQVKVESYKKEDKSCHMLYLMAPFFIKAGEECKLPCVFGYLRAYYRSPSSYTWGDFEFKLRDIQPKDRFASIRGLIFSTNDTEPIDKDKRVNVCERQEDQQEGYCNII